MKKLLSMILALLMLTLPVLATAEGSVGIIGGADGPTEIVVAKELPTTRYQDALAAGRRVNQTITLTELTGVNTGDPMADAAIADLVKALGFNFSAQGDEAMLTMSLSDKEVATFGHALSGENVYLSSNMLGGTVVLGLEELEPLANRILDAMVTMGVIGEEEVAMLRESIASFKAEFDAAMQEETLEDQVVAELDFSALKNFMPEIESKVVLLEQVVVPRMCDPAVAGAQVVFTNEDVIAASKAFAQFLLDNPALLDLFASAFGVPTTQQLEASWAAGGELYMAFGIYESKEAFLADQPSMENVIREAMNELETRKVIEGDYTLSVCVDEAGEPVYATLHLPMLADFASGVEATEVINIDLTYTRQTVPQGVAHVCNISVEDVTVTIDALVGEGSTTVTVTSVEPEWEPAKLFDLSIKEAASETNPGVTCVDVDATLYGAEEPTLEIAYDGEYENSDVREYVAGKLTMTAYQRQLDYTGETAAINTVSTDVILEFSSDTAINGIDYTTDASFALEAGGVRFGMQMTEATTDPEPSIMTGNVVRPMELNDADFSNWFTGVINSFNVWMAQALQSLPESVLMLIIYSGMM